MRSFHTPVRSWLVHMYNHMEATLERIKAIFLDNLRRYVEGRTLRNQVR